jgi:methionyl-tRNA formyltransferase
MRLAFLGTPEAAVPSLRALLAAGHDVQMVVSQPDRRRGRGTATSPSPVKAAALAAGLPVAAGLSSLDGLDLDYGVVVAYGEIIPKAVLARIPMLNVHFSLLPRWRGAAPVERAILAGDEETGVGIISLEASLDTGPLHGERRTRVDEKTASELTSELAQLGAKLLVEVLADPVALASPRAQVGEATYAAKLGPELFHLAPSLTREEALRVIRLERAFILVAGRRLRLVRATRSDSTCPSGQIIEVGERVVVGFRDAAIVLDEVQPEGSRPMPARAWWVGARLDRGATWE